MKNITLAAIIAAATTTSAAAMDLGATGLSLNTEAVGEYNVDTENLLMTIEPTLGYTFASLDLSVGALIPVYDDDIVIGDNLPTLDFEVSKNLLDGWKVYGEVSYDLEAEDRGDLVIGTSFNF